MNQFIVLLRGINVSGQKLIKMADLRESLSKAGFEAVQTYIQSGNIILETKESGAEVVEQQVKELILNDFGFDVKVMVTTADYLKQSVAQNPFPEADIKRLALAIMDSQPLPERIALLGDVDKGSEEFMIDGLNIYLHAPDGFGKAKLHNNLFESKLKVNATTRNWNTINKLIDLANK